LIDAIAMIEKRRPGAIKVIFAGDAQGRVSYLTDMKSAIEKHGLQDVVVIAGHIGHMPTAFAASNIAVFPVIEPEAFGRGAVEAQAMGVPVIASNLGGFTETVIDGETGFLAPPGAAPALAGVIERLIDLGPEARGRMGWLAQDRARRLYAKTALQTATLAVYRRLLDEAAARAAQVNKGAAVL
jgi:glycosyltransferase involved in cell wall biosynthesis